MAEGGMATLYHQAQTLKSFSRMAGILDWLIRRTALLSFSDPSKVQREASSPCMTGKVKKKFAS